MDVRFLVLSFLLLLGGCLPEATVSKGKITSSQGDTTTPVDPTIPNSPTQWNYLAGNFNSITVYASNLNNAYITGYETEVFLSRQENFKDQTYCLISDYTLAGIRRQMRTRAVPVSYYDFTAKRSVRVLRIDFDVISSDVEELCSQSLYSYNSLGEYELDSTVPATVVYKASSLCPTCTSRLSSTKIRLFKVKGKTGLYEVPVQSIKLTGLGLIVDPNNGTGGGGNGSCSIASCQAQGYDCCLEEQCVDNSAVRPSAQTLYPNEYAAAEQERLRDPLAWMRYPHIYYVCPNYIPPSTGTTTGGTGGGSSTGSTTGPDHQQGLAQIKKDLVCLENIKSQSPSVPFHQDLLAHSGYVGNAECITEESTNALKEFMHYKNVAKRLYSFCGCSYSELSDMISYCPAYYYKPLSTNSSGEVTSFECSVLKEDTIPTFQEVGVSTRSAPHRFFNANGVEFSSPDQSNLAQEGDQFSYLDEDNNNHSQEKFGINSILGPMSITLDKALPAKQVSVELDQVYLIRTISGYYTPCETCGPDKWHESLTAYPRTNWGIGLQAIGFSTKRDDIDGNITGGNYEDTIFGRACWVPPTMLPFTHEAVTGANNDPTNQRRARLQAQAVLYSNGYQRDWFGFNKGALIGSFDGVSWFAIGNGRLVKSSSKKLFLAINAPFADLASSSIHNVQISRYDGYSTAAQVDYDPQYHLSHPLQNQAGNCQANHMCDTDSDCITRLGWEYACADVSQLKTKWPNFDPITLREQIGAEVVTIDQILAQKKFPSASTKRCVYRGAGAICLSNSNSITDLNQKKIMTCAPNFYCAALSSSTNISGQVSRYATNLDNLIVNNNHLYGQDANVLGRPLNYLGENGTQIPQNSVNAIRANIATNHQALASTGAGICRPGKNLPILGNNNTNDPFKQHESADSQKRADFINQIASCNSTLYSPYRHSSCPVLDNNGNYLQFLTSSIPANYHLLASNQNSCGLESIATDTALNSGISILHQSSAFYSIEAVPLNQKTVSSPTLVRDACLRRAGAVCHTDLDCSPNKMHETASALRTLRFFGNEAEMNYWKESLVCGQATPKPSIYDTEATKNYDHTLNRCCREIGNDLTTVTTDTPRSTLNNQYFTYSEGLITAAHPGTIANNEKRYSRLATVEGLGSADRPTLSANTSRNSSGELLYSDNITKSGQWKTLREANSETCCGGGWIRKFADGSNDWRQKNRLQINVNNFSCLNSRHPLLTINESVIPGAIEDLYLPQGDMRSLINRDYQEYCQDTTGTEGSCAQNSFLTGQDEVWPTSNPFGTIIVNTLSGNFSYFTDYLFKPFSGDAHTGVTMVYDSTTAGARKNISIRIPSYIPRTAFDQDYLNTPVDSTSQGIELVSENAQITCAKKNWASLPLSSHTDPGTCSSGCCYSYNPDSRILRVAVAPNANANIRNKESGVRFSVDLAGFNSYVSRTSPGNDIYYLNRLARLELSGIPQVTFEALYCNDNSFALLPGMFKTSLMKTANDFEKSTHSFKVDTQWHTTYHALEQPPVFSEDKFKCCMPLGKTTTKPGNCCSGYGVKDNKSDAFTCSLPTGTDLMVYLNPFVSNEGLSLGMEEGHFNSTTGEPLLSSTVINKITQIGKEHCEGKKVRQGGAFGNFEPEPQGSRTDVSKRIYQIVDSSNDVGQVTNAGATLPSGYNVFNQGYRWNHHLYCTE